MLDLLIRNATVVDGTGKPAFRADVGIHRSQITEIGALAGESADKEIDADGAMLTPGFIDITNHSDVTAALLLNPNLGNLLRQGITTIVGGNCGMSLAPLTDPDIVHGIRTWTQTSSVNVNWLSVAEFFRELEHRGIGANFAMFAGHGTIRRGITKEAARALTPEERREFKSVLAKALDEGVLGLSVNLNASLESDASATELSDLLSVLSEKGGVCKLHLRNEGRDFLSAVNEALRISLDSRVPMIVSHFKAVGRKAWPMFAQGLRMIDGAYEKKETIAFDVYPYATTGSQLADVLPSWVRSGGYHAMMERIREPATRSKIIEDLTALDLHYDRLRIAEADDGISPGKTITELAARSGSQPAETLLQVLAVNQGRVSIIGRTLSSRNVQLAIRHPLSLIATNGTAYGDGEVSSLPHPRSYGTFPRFLYRYVVQRPAFSWEEAIAKITLRPAELLGLKNRGRIEKGHAADLVLFDPAKIRDHANYENPYQPPEGISHVIVNGVTMVERGVLNDKRPGQVLRKT